MDPKIVCSGKILSIADILGRFPNIAPSNVIQIDTEWRLLRNTKLNTEDENLEVGAFWKKIAQMHLGDGRKIFPNLTLTVLSFMCLPHSSASVERLFSQINLTKTKLRNQLSTPVISGGLHTKNILKNSNCFNFEIKDQILQKLNKNMY
ncbi:unnamed protein product [Pieris macdunnoughi]|uniref:HAT C-terminal dimerisation domain-containing protein n=1 Tax=Pieris macdunnoughi TaxID=345717 RepID=A0A821PN11_9NEOP|nr:unnamed protein product [Pieris macdunnoughi]